MYAEKPTLSYMAMVYTIQVRLRSKEEREEIKQRAREKGFGDLSSYLRYLALARDFAVFDQVTAGMRKLDDIHEHLLEAPPAEVKQNRPKI